MNFTHMTLGRALHNRQEPESLHVFANVFWRLLILLGTSFAICLITYNAWVYIDVSKALSGNAVIIESSSAEKPPFDRARLSAVVEGIQARKKLFQLYIAEPLDVSDPSR